MVLNSEMSDSYFAIFSPQSGFRMSNFPGLTHPDEEWKITRKDGKNLFHKLNQYDHVWCQENKSECFFCVGGKYERPVSEIYILCSLADDLDCNNKTLFRTKVFTNWKNGLNGIGHSI